MTVDLDQHLHFMPRTKYQRGHCQRLKVRVSVRNPMLLTTTTRLARRVPFRLEARRWLRSNPFTKMASRSC